jgi:plastocyanin
MRWTIALAALGIAVLGVAAFSIGSRGSADAAPTQVNVGNYYFCEDADQGKVCETDITAGDPLTWSVEEGTHHVVQCTDANFTACPLAGGFDGGNFSTGQTFSHTFATAGTFFYHCAIHPTEMMGKVVVAATVTAAPTAAPTVAATVAATAAPTATAAKVPAGGGPPASGGPDLWAYALLALGMTLLGGSGLAFALARKR